MPLLGLISNKISELSGEGNSITTKVDQNNFNNCFWTNRVMESVRDGATWDKNHAGSTDAWYLRGNGFLWGNGKYGDDYAGIIKEGQVISMEANLDKDKGTLRFWVDGKPYGLGWDSGVAGRLRWVVCLFCKGAAAEIVPTPELQPLTPWVPPERDA